MKRGAAGGGRWAALALCSCPAAALSAEFVDVARDNIVLARARPDYDAIGVPLGAFRAYPSLTAATAYDDNVFDRSTPAADAFVDLAPRLAVESGWSRNFLKLTADATVERFARITSENSERFAIDAFGRVDVDHATVVEADALFARRVEARGSSGDVAAATRPIVFHDAGGHVGATTTRGTLTFHTRVDFDDLRYEAAIVGAQSFPQAFRNHRATVALAEVSTPLGAQVGAIVAGSYNDQTYPDRDQGVVPLDAHGWTALAGVRFGVTSVTSGQITAGYLRQSFRAPSFPAIAGPAYDARIVWNPTPLVSVTATARRFVEASPMTNVAGIVADTVGVAADYELLRNLLVNLRADYASEAYRGIDRLDRRATAGVGVRYLINAMLQVGVNYDYRDQTSRGTGARAYRGNAVAVRLTVQR